MPRVNIYIRNEDYDKWKAIEGKPEWLHGQITGEELFDVGMNIIGEDEIPEAHNDQKYSDEVRVHYVNNLKQRMREQLAYVSRQQDKLKEINPEYDYKQLTEPKLTPPEDSA